MKLARGSVHSVRGQPMIRYWLQDQDVSHIKRAIDVLAQVFFAAGARVVHAPIGGTVVQRQIGLGQNIVSASAGASSPVFMIGDLSKVWMVANAREDDAPYLHKGDPVEVRVLAYPNRVFKGRLNYVAASLDATTFSTIRAFGTTSHAVRTAHF